MTPLRDLVDAAYERWAYGEGWSAGLLEGRRRGFEEGYGAGFDTGVEVGAQRVLLGLQHALGGHLPSVLDGPSDLPHTAAYLTYRGLTALDDEPCAYGCRACSRCIRAATVRRNRRRHGQADFPGASPVRRGRSR